MKLRHPVALGLLGVALAGLTVVVAVATVDANVRLNELYQVNGMGGQMAMEALVRTQNLLVALDAVLGWLALAAAVPGIAALGLLVLRGRDQRASASATASRDA